MMPKGQQEATVEPQLLPLLVCCLTQLAWRKMVSDMTYYHVQIPGPTIAGHGNSESAINQLDGGRYSFPVP